MASQCSPVGDMHVPSRSPVNLYSTILYTVRDDNEENKGIRRAVIYAVDCAEHVEESGIRGRVIELGDEERLSKKLLRVWEMK